MVLLLLCFFLPSFLSLPPFSFTPFLYFFFSLNYLYALVYDTLLFALFVCFNLLDILDSPSSQPLFPATSVIVQWAHEKVAMVAKRKVMHELSNMNFHSMRPTWLWPMLGAQSASNRNQHWAPDMAPFSGVIGWLLVAGWLHWLLPSSKWQHFVLSRIDTHSVYKFVFSRRSTVAQTIICGLRECLIHHHSMPNSIVSDQGTHFTENEMQKWACAQMKFTGIIVFTTSLTFIEWWNGLLKSQLQCQLDGNTLQG